MLITGAAGNLGAKLRQHLQDRYELRLLDREPRGDAAILHADLCRWEPAWADQYRGAEVVVHLAADPAPHRNWAELVGPNIDAVIHTLQAAVRAGVRRVVYASSNHVMGGYKDLAEPARITTDLPPRPGMRFGPVKSPWDSTAYGAAKLFGERLGQCYAEAHGLSVIAVRIGLVRAAQNPPPQPRSATRRWRSMVRLQAGVIDPSEWFRMMWLSNRDFCQLMERCILAEPAVRFAVVNGMSANTGMRWDIDYTRQLVGYEPQDDVTAVQSSFHD